MISFVASAQNADRLAVTEEIFIKSPALCPPPEMYGLADDFEVQRMIAARHGVTIPIRLITVFRSCPVATFPAVAPWLFAPDGWTYNQEKNRYEREEKKTK